VLDLIVGVGDWTEYGWDNAYNKQGEWQRGPLHGYVYLLANRGSTAQPNYADPVKILADGQPIDVYGMPSPNLADFDGDGDLDLICGEFLDGFSYFENTGNRAEPRYEFAGRLQDAGQPIRMDLQMIVPTAIDWDRDGDVDLICGDEDGRVALIEHTGRMAGRVPGFLAPVYFQQQADLVKFGALVTPVSVDWDSDGDEDLICGNSAGYVALIENLDGGNPPQWAPPIRLQAGNETLRIQAGNNGSIQGPCEAKWGYTTLSVADWNHDGLLDLVVNSIWGKVVWYRNIGDKHHPRLATAAPIEVEWPAGSTPPKPAWNWWDPKGKELSTQWRTTPAVIDWNRDGLNDLVMLDHEGYLTFFPRVRTNGAVTLAPPQRVFLDAAGNPLRFNAGEAGRSGRRKFCFADWDGDGNIDLLVNSRSVNLWRNVSTESDLWRFTDEGPIDPRHLAGHTTSPTVVDWNGDGRADLLTGAEDGHFYYQPNNWKAPQTLENDDMVIQTRNVENGVLDNGELAFANRKYTWFDVPASLQGWPFTRTSGGEKAFVAVQAKRNTTVTMAISRGHAGVDLAGWELAPGQTFGYSDSGRTPMQVFTKRLDAGERVVIPQGTWTGSLLLIPSNARFTFPQDDTTPPNSGT